MISFIHLRAVTSVYNVFVATFAQTKHYILKFVVNMVNECILHRCIFVAISACRNQKFLYFVNRSQNNIFPANSYFPFLYTAYVTQDSIKLEFLTTKINSTGSAKPNYTLEARATWTRPAGSTYSFLTVLTYFLWHFVYIYFRTYTIHIFWQKGNFVRVL